jgi:hypothetical protein
MPDSGEALAVSPSLHNAPTRFTPTPSTAKRLLDFCRPDQQRQHGRGLSPRHAPFRAIVRRSPSEPRSRSPTTSRRARRSFMIAARMRFRSTKWRGSQFDGHRLKANQNISERADRRSTSISKRQGVAPRQAVQDPHGHAYRVHRVAIALRARASAKSDRTFKPNRQSARSRAEVKYRPVSSCGWGRQ